MTDGGGLVLVGDGFEVVGVAVAGPAPLGRVEMEFEPGVTALYGLNGSGKTRLLTAIAEAIDSRATNPNAPGQASREIAVHVRESALREVAPLGTWINAARHALETRLFDAAREGLDTDPWTSKVAERDLLTPPDSIRDLAKEVADFGLPGYIAWLPEHARDALAEVIADEGLLNVQMTSGRLACEPAVSLDALISCGADRLLWDCITWIDHVIATNTIDDKRGHPAFDVGSLFFDRRLSPSALAGAGRGEHSKSYRADWNPIPIGAPGALDSSPCRLVGWVTDQTTLRGRSLLALRAAAGPKLVEAALDDEVELTATGAAALEAVVERALHFLGLTLLDGPRLRLRVGLPDEWLDGSAPEWEALDDPSGTWVPLSALSRAQLRWAVLAIELAIADTADNGNPIVILLDEPEAALHRAAERHLVAGLKQLALELNAAVLVATHSPAFLSDPGVRAIHVHRAGPGLAIASKLSAPLHDPADRQAALQRLGLGSADALQLIRVVVAVEGAHDEAVLEAIAGDVIADSRCLVLRMQGAKNTTAVLDSQLIMDMTDATVLVVLDNIAAHDLDPMWQRLRNQAQAGDLRQGRKAIDDVHKLGTAEAKWLAALAERALNLGRLDRLEVFGLSEPDIIQYLDPAQFSLTSGWAELACEWRTDPGHKTDFKKWLRGTKHVSVSTQKVRRAAENMIEPPQDLQHLIDRIRQLGLQPAGAA